MTKKDRVHDVNHELGIKIEEIDEERQKEETDDDAA
jgi:hypothetical protein